MERSLLNRREFLGASSAALGLGGASSLSAQGRDVPLGLQLYSVRDHFEEDEFGTLKAVAAMGYPLVEFYDRYFSWTPGYATEVRALMDDLGLECRSTHNQLPFFKELDKAIELNQILGAKNIFLAWIPPTGTLDADGWKKLVVELSDISERLKPLGMATGFHNHQFEWRTLEGLGNMRVMDFLAAHTPPEFVLQFDVGTCVQMDADPVGWIKANPGRIKSVHCKDWGAGDGPNRGYRVLFGEGDAPWKEIFAAAESTGGVEYYLMEQEGSRFDSFETARKCLGTYREMRA